MKCLKLLLKTAKQRLSNFKVCRLDSNCDKVIQCMINDRRVSDLIKL